MKIKSLAGSALSLAFVSTFLFPVSAQATDGCDIRSNPCREFSAVDGYIVIQGNLIDLTQSFTLTSPESRVELRLITPSAAVLSAWNVTQHGTHISCQLDEETNFYVGYSSAQGVTSDVIFQGQSQTITSTTTPHGEHSLIAASFAVPQSATLGAFSCSSGLGYSNGPGTGFGDSYIFTLNLNRTFTPSTPTPTPSASTRSTPTPTASASPRGTSSPSPSASAEATNEEDEVEARSSEVVVLGNTESQNEASPIGFFLAGTLSALAGVGATVAFIQRKAIIEAFAKLKKIAKP